MNTWRRICACGTVCMTVLLISSLVQAESRVIDLFDGRTLDGWTTESGSPVTQGWQVEDGLLVRHERGGAIYTAEEYGDFQLDFEWRIAPGGNSGIKYRVAFYEKGVRGNPGHLGCEYQLFDDAGRRINPKNSTASIYDLFAPNDKKQLKPVGQFNHSRIVARGTHVEHWLNGEKVVEVDTTSDEWKRRSEESKFGIVEGFFQNPRGRIQLQDHGSKVWFRQIKLTLLDEE